MHVAPEYEQAAIPEHFRDLAFAYLDAAERLCGDLANGSWSPTYHKGQVTLWLAFHAVELFLKGCVWKVSPEQVKKTHSLGELLLAFSSAFPGVEFEPPFGAEPVPAIWELMELVLKSDATLHQRLRYPVDTSGSPWGGVRTFSADMFLVDLGKLRADFSRISVTVFAK